MNIKTRLIIPILLSMFSACSTQPIHPEQNTSSKQVDSIILETTLPSKNISSLSTLTTVKAGETLKLVKIMDGGACNSNQQGIVGVFSLYANAEDIIRVTQQSGTDVFANYALQIQTFSMRALQQTVNQLDFQTNSHKLTEKDIHQQIVNNFSTLFIDSIANDITEFETRTTLTIDVVSQPDSLTIFQNNCKTPHDH